METVPNTFPSLFWAYSALWLLVCVYFLSMAAKIRRLEKSRQEEPSE